ncbi:MAG TPA: hypothetical protein VN651_03245 [Gemmatimonadaceae bacterium]|nr:hypothetical protein [Gemmatimonadaceae bacterium]
MATAQGDPPAGRARDYLGVGCLTTAAGFAGGGMISVLIAKIVGAASKCPSDAETGAPCNWFTYAVFGAIIGAFVLPVVSIWSLRRTRRRAAMADIAGDAENSKRG